MIATNLRDKRIRNRIAGQLVCKRAGITRSRLSDIERGYVEPSADELARLDAALNSLIDAKLKVAAAATECGWPISGL